MIQIFIILCGVLIVISGALGLKKGKFMLSRNKPLVGAAATAGNLVTIAVGVAALVYALAVLPGKM